MRMKIDSFIKMFVDLFVIIGAVEIIIAIYNIMLYSTRNSKIS